MVRVHKVTCCLCVQANRDVILNGDRKDLVDVSGKRLMDALVLLEEVFFQDLPFWVEGHPHFQLWSHPWLVKHETALSEWCAIQRVYTKHMEAVSGLPSSSVKGIPNSGVVLP